MPYASFGLLRAIRSHRIDSPSAAMTVQGRPNACSLCHSDRTLQWTADWLTVWYGQPDVEHGAEPVAASVVQLLSGDAVQRAVAAWSLGWPPAREAAGSDWQPVLLTLLLDDPYSAVRFTAWQSLRSYPGFEDVEYDLDGLTPDSRETLEQALTQWRESLSDSPEWAAAVPLDSQRELNRRVIDDLIQRRDNTPIELPE